MPQTRDHAVPTSEKTDFAGEDAIELAEQAATELREQIDASRDRSISMAFDDE